MKRLSKQSSIGIEWKPIMSSRPPGQDRFTQMSEQAAIIARKKAEIEAKIKAAAEAKESSSKVSGSQSSSTNQTETPGKSLKNRW